MAVLTPFQTDLRQLAAGILYINLGRAAPEFPGSTRGHPSYKVLVALTPPADSQDALGHLFPFLVSGGLWQSVVVPLFEEGSTLVKVIEELRPSLRLPMNQIRLSQDLEGLLATIEKALLVVLEDLGYLPSSATSVGYVAVLDGPLVYQTDLQLAAAERAYQTAVLAEAEWEDDLEDGEPSQQSVDPDADLSTVQVVLAPSSPGEPVERLSTGSKVYQQFDE